jgi:hypothetical protein
VLPGPHSVDGVEIGVDQDGRRARVVIVTAMQEQYAPNFGDDQFRPDPREFIGQWNSVHAPVDYDRIAAIVREVVGNQHRTVASAERSLNAGEVARKIGTNTDAPAKTANGQCDSLSVRLRR